MAVHDDDLQGLRVPFLFVPDGAEPSATWLAEHPGWVKLPARFVPQGTGPGQPRRMSPRDDAFPAPRNAVPPRSEWEPSGPTLA